MTTLPVYLVVDTSDSLAGDIDDLNLALAELLQTLRIEALAADVVRVAVIQFSSVAREVVPLTDVRDLTRIPDLMADGFTDYGNAFRLVRGLIIRDVAASKNQGDRVLRPIMFFISDGSPADPDWQEALRELQSTEFRERPTIVAFGIGSVDPEVLREVGRGKGGAFMVSSALSTGDAIRSVFDGLMNMLSSTVQSSASPSATVPPIALSDDWLDLTAIPDAGQGL